MFTFLTLLTPTCICASPSSGLRYFASCMPILTLESGWRGLTLVVTVIIFYLNQTPHHPVCTWDRQFWLSVCINVQTWTLLSCHVNVSETSLYFVCFVEITSILHFIEMKRNSLVKLINQEKSRRFYFGTFHYSLPAADYLMDTCQFKELGSLCSNILGFLASLFTYFHFLLQLRYSYSVVHSNEKLYVYGYSLTY